MEEVKTYGYHEADNFNDERMSEKVNPRAGDARNTVDAPMRLKKRGICLGKLKLTCMRE